MCRMTTDIASVLKRADRLAEKSGLALSTISTQIFKDGKRIAALKAGKRAWPETVEVASKRLAELETSHGIRVRA